MQLFLRATLSLLVGGACLTASGCSSDAMTGSIEATPPAQLQQRVERSRPVANPRHCVDGNAGAGCLTPPLASIETPAPDTGLSEPLPAGIKPLALEQEEQFGKAGKKK